MYNCNCVVTLRSLIQTETMCANFRMMHMGVDSNIEFVN